MNELRWTRWLYFRLLGVTALIATGSFWAQAKGLIGEAGIWPAAGTVRELLASGVGFWDAPTLLRLSPTDAMLNALLAACALGSVAIAVGLFTPVALVVTWASWLSVVIVGGPFLQFQWDIFLLEALACSLPWAFGDVAWKPRSTAASWARWPLVILAVKVTFESGLVKLLSGDTSWRDLTALDFHFWTQPLVTWTSYLFAALPMAVKQAMCAVMFVLELPAPLFAFVPRFGKRIAGLSIIVLQAALGVAGNYSYYNLLALVVAVPLLDDGVVPARVSAWAPDWLRRWGAASRGNIAPGAGTGLEAGTGTAAGGDAPSARTGARRWGRRAAATAVVLYGVLSAVAFVERWTRLQPPRAVSALLEWQRPLELINSYGAFATMTRTRPEIILEGSADGFEWAPYEFFYKPGPVDVRPEWVAPFQPRLDWQMWFAALSSCQHNPWLHSTFRHLLLGSPEVLALFKTNPFAAAPPRYLRSTVWEYRFGSARSRGEWWERTKKGPYCPTVTLNEEGNLVVARDIATADPVAP